MSLVQHFQRNQRGRDFAVGDIHGHFSKLQAALDAIGFDPAVDRLFSVGDLVDRGPESEESLAWLARPWFHAVRGNHEDIAIRHVANGKVDVNNYTTNGGAWFLAMAEPRQEEFADAFSAMPLAMDVETEAGLVGLLHADCPTSNWASLESKLIKRRSARDRAMWSRDRIHSENAEGVAGVYAVIVGHTPVREPLRLGNVFHIDTRGWKPNGYFTLMELGTLDVPSPERMLEPALPTADDASIETGVVGSLLRWWRSPDGL